MADPASSFTAIAHPNIALIKYWGKRDVARNLPAVGSLSVTLDGLRARTSVGFDADLQHDQVILNGREDVGAARRVTACLDRLRREAGIRSGARVISDNDFPTGAGLASSAAGIAALVTAAAAALRLTLPAERLIDIACLGSGSAPRSLYGGLVAMRNLPDGCITCESVLAPESWPVSIIIAVTATEPKAVSSREGMELSRQTSPFYAEWVGGHEADLGAALEHVRQRDFAALGELAEHNCLKMHSVMMTTRPPLLYWTAATLACMHVVQQLRRGGVPVFFTVDAGPQVKALCAPGASEVVRQALAAVPGVQRIISSKPGSGARCISVDE
jgi:diphosphomevalonate decarboxylase